MSAATRIDECSGEGVLFVALELSKKTWKVGSTVAPAQRPREKNVPGGKPTALEEEIRRAKKRFGLAETAQVVCCFEAGRDGHWIHRYLVSRGVINVEVDPASIDVNRRKRRAKTDRLDVEKLLSNLMRWWAGEHKVWSVVVVPTVADEDARHFHRERDALKRERTRHINRIKGLLMAQGVRVETISKSFGAQLEGFHLYDGSPLPPQLRQRLEREYERLELVDQQLAVLAKQRREALKHSTSDSVQKVRDLNSLRGIGERGSWTLVGEMFGWRTFNNRRQVGSFAGLTGTPSDSGDSDREQGIDKAGNPRVRAVLIEMAWSWVRWQPHSEITLWFNRKFAGAGKRHRRVGIVGVARRLLIALWRFLEQGIVPAGAIVFNR